MPYKLFELGECIVVDGKTDTGARNVRKIAAVCTDEVSDTRSKGLFSIVHGAMDILLKKCNQHFPKDYILK